MLKRRFLCVQFLGIFMMTCCLHEHLHGQIQSQLDQYFQDIELKGPPKGRVLSMRQPTRQPPNQLPLPNQSPPNQLQPNQPPPNQPPPNQLPYVPNLPPGESLDSNENLPREMETLKPLSEISLSIRGRPTFTPRSFFTARYPNALAGTYSTGQPRSPLRNDYHWHASGIKYATLYFEDVPLERHGLGYSPLIQPVVSYTRFLLGTIMLPYKMGVDGPLDMKYALGFDRPGNHALGLYHQLPWSWRGAAMQTSAVIGASMLTP